MSAEKALIGQLELGAALCGPADALRKGGWQAVVAKAKNLKPYLLREDGREHGSTNYA